MLMGRKAASGQLSLSVLVNQERGWGWWLKELAAGPGGGSFMEKLAEGTFKTKQAEADEGHYTTRHGGDKQAAL